MFFSLLFSAGIDITLGKLASTYKICMLSNVSYGNGGSGPACRDTDQTSEKTGSLIWK
jgi:hypothetical protein